MICTQGATLAVAIAVTKGAAADIAVLLGGLPVSVIAVWILAASG